MPTPEPGSSGLSAVVPGATAAGSGGPGPALLGAAAVGVAAGALVTGASFAAVAGPWALAGVLLATQASLGWAWAKALGASVGTVVLVAVSALAGDLAVLWPGADDGRGGHGYDDNGIGTVAGVVGVSLALTVLYQLARRLRPGGAGLTSPSPDAVPAGSTPPGPTPEGSIPEGAVPPPRAADRVSVDMAAALGGVTIAAFLTGFLVLRAEAGAEHPPDSMVIAGLLGAGTAVLVGRVVIALLGPSRFRVPAGAALGAAVGTVAGVVFGDVTELGVPAAAALAAAGAVAAACALPVGPVPVGPVPVESLPVESALPGRWSGAGAGLLLGVLLPLALAAPMVYLVGRQLPG